MGYTYTDTKYRDDSQHQGESYNTLTPRHMLRVWSNYDLPWDERNGVWAAVCKLRVHTAQVTVM